MKNPRCKTCRRNVWGNFGDGLWRHMSEAGKPLMSTLCLGNRITPEESPVS